MRSFLAVLALAIFALPASGAHLHVCVDGADGEPPASVHVGDACLHHPGNAGDVHDDMDASLESGAVVKKTRSFLELPACLLPTPVLFMQPVATAVDFPRGHLAPIVSVVAYRILPPLRAPPV